MLLVGILLPAVSSIIKAIKDKSDKNRKKDNMPIPEMNETEDQYYEFEDLEPTKKEQTTFDPFKEIFNSGKSKSEAPKSFAETVKSKSTRTQSAGSRTMIQGTIGNKNVYNPINKGDKIDKSIQETRKNNDKQNCDVKSLLRNKDSVKEAVILSEILKPKF